MDFFEHQDVARKKTGRLVLLFGAAVVCIGLVLYAVMVLALGYLMKDRETGLWAIEWVNPGAALIAGGLLVLIVGGGTTYKLLQLRAGGHVVARSLSGRLVTRDTADREEAVLLNIVEEMAIASGTPVPPVYVMDGERGINAFAAGYAPETAVIGVTRGAIEALTRSELQGVIAHEFSHILNGDMRLNIRLMGIIHGILLLGIVGTMVIRGFFYGAVVGGGRSHRGGGGGGGGDKRGGGGQIVVVIIVVGVTLMVLGAIGTFFGTWIKSAVSRQREYLADASAVQFTRDPSTIAGALKAIGGWKHRARVASPHAPEASHMFFGQAITSGFNNIFATHPPLKARIKRVDPSWDGQIERRGEPAYPSVNGGPSRFDRGGSPGERVAAAEAEARSGTGRFGAIGGALELGVSPAEFFDRGGSGGGSAGGSGGGGDVVMLSALEAIGTIDEAHVQHARTLLRSIPAPIREATNDAFSARAVVFGLLLHDEGPDRRKQLEHLKASADPAVVRALAKILPSLENLKTELRLPILDIAAPALASMTAAQARTFLDNARALAEADEHIEPFEWALLRIVERRLSGVLGAERRQRVDYYALNKLTEEASVLLSAVARAGHGSPEDQQRAFDHGAKLLRVPGVRLMGAGEADTRRLGAALDTLVRTAPRVKKQLLAACATSIGADKRVTAGEAELFRVIADELGVPTPPLMPGQPLV